MMTFFRRHTVLLGLSVAVAAAAFALGVYSGSFSQDPVDAVVSRLVGEEGFRSHPYRDTEGHLTVGYGLNLDAGISEGLARNIARWEVAAAADEFEGLWPQFVRQPHAVQVELADMAFQLGARGLRRFERMLAAIDAGDWDEAARQVEASAFARQTPARAAAARQVFLDQVE